MQSVLVSQTEQSKRRTFCGALLWQALVPGPWRGDRATWPLSPQALPGTEAFPRGLSLAWLLASRLQMLAGPMPLSGHACACLHAPAGLHPMPYGPGPCCAAAGSGAAGRRLPAEGHPYGPVALCPDPPAASSHQEFQVTSRESQQKWVLALCRIAKSSLHLTFLSRTFCKVSSKNRLDESIPAILV